MLQYQVVPQTAEPSWQTRGPYAVIVYLPGKYLLSTYSMPVTVFGEETAANMAPRDCPYQLTISKYLLYPQQAQTISQQLMWTPCFLSSYSQLSICLLDSCYWYSQVQKTTSPILWHTGTSLWRNLTEVIPIPLDTKNDLTFQLKLCTFTQDVPLLFGANKYWSCKILHPHFKNDECKAVLRTMRGKLWTRETGTNGREQ